MPHRTLNEISSNDSYETLKKNVTFYQQSQNLTEFSIADKILA